MSDSLGQNGLLGQSSLLYLRRKSYACKSVCLQIETSYTLAEELLFYKEIKGENSFIVPASLFMHLVPLNI